jgi:hypothetical protein
MSKAAKYVTVIGGMTAAGATLGPIGAIGGGAVGAGGCLIDYMVNGDDPPVIEAKAKTQKKARAIKESS